MHQIMLVLFKYMLSWFSRN